MQSGGYLVCNKCIDGAVTIYPAHTLKRLGHNLDSQMGFAASVKAFLVTGMQMALVDDLKRKWLQGRFNFFVNALRKSHFRQSFVVRPRTSGKLCPCRSC